MVATPLNSDFPSNQGNRDDDGELLLTFTDASGVVLSQRMARDGATAARIAVTMMACREWLSAGMTLRVTAPPAPGEVFGPKETD